MAKLPGSPQIAGEHLDFSAERETVLRARYDSAQAAGADIFRSNVLPALMDWEKKEDRRDIYIQLLAGMVNALPVFGAEWEHFKSWYDACVNEEE